MNLDRLDDLRSLPPWRSEAFTEIGIGLDREIVIDRAENVRSASDTVVYSDASGREGQLGATVVALDDNLVIAESK